MGGGAFAHAAAAGKPTLKTPRMSPDDYRRLKDTYMAKLRTYFPTGQVVCLTEAPEKADYGDMDIFVALDERVDFVAMANELSAAGVICNGGGRVQKCTLGVRKDGGLSIGPTVVYTRLTENRARGQSTLSSAETTTEDYTQVDIEIVPPALLEWHTFFSSYGDMAGLIGYIVTNLGFRTTDIGFLLRMKELDVSKTLTWQRVADEDGMIFLSRDPKKVMSFLGLSWAKYDAGFKTLEQFYQWLGECRLLSAVALQTKRGNSNERNREQKRTVFSRFFHEWLPAHMDMDDAELPEKEKQLEKLDVLRRGYCDEALDFFEVRAEYDAKHAEVLRGVQNDTAVFLIKPLIAKHSGKGDKQLLEIVRAFRRFVGVNEEGGPRVLDRPRSDAESELYKLLGEDRSSLRYPEAISGWVEVHWDELRTLERQRKRLSSLGNVET